MKRKFGIYGIIALSLCLILAGCGKTETQETQSKGETAETEKSPADYTGTISVWSWTDDPVYQIEAFNKVYPNVTVDLTQIGDGYDVKMQTIVDNESSGPDVFAADVKTVKNYIEADAWENLSESPYDADGLASGMVPYVRTMGSDDEGNLRALTWQATPGGFWYKRSLAKTYLGTDDPAEISQMMTSMDDFFALGKTIYEKSGHKTFMIPHYQDLWTFACYSQRSLPWVKDNTLQMDPYVIEFFDIAKQARDENLDAKLKPWSNAWYAAAENDSIFGYLLPTWGLQYVIQNGAPDSKGDWAIASAPSSYFNGGTFMGIYSKSKNKDLAWQFLKFVTTDKDYLEQYVQDKADFPSSEDIIEETVADYSNEWTGDQNTFAFFSQEADKIDTSLVTKYDDSINTLYLAEVEQYVNGTLTKEQAIEQFKKDVASAYHSLTIE